MRQAQQLGQDDAGLSVSEIVGLEAGEDKIGRLCFESRGQQISNVQSIERCDIDVYPAVGALGQGFANGLRRRAPDRR